MSYHATEKNISGSILAKILFDNVSNLIRIGFNVCAVVCDQGANNRKCFSDLNVTLQNPYFHVNNNKVFAIYDAPHLIKSIRNNLMAVDFVTPDGKASWSVLKELYECEQNQTTKLCPKLTSKHIYPNTFERMRVSFATQTFSRTVVAGIKTMVDFNKFSDNVEPVALSTAKFIEKLDTIFDNLNSRMLRDANPNKSALQKNNIVHKNMLKMYDYIDRITPATKRTIYCLNGMKQTINGIIQLLEHLQDKNNEIKFVFTGRLNQDPVENFFGLIRQRGGNNKTPSVYEFNNISGQILTMKFLGNTDLTNCLNDGDEILDSNGMMNDFLYDDNSSSNVNMTGSIESAQNILNADLDEYEDLDQVIMAADLEYEIDKFDDSATKYFLGYVAYKMLNKFKCEICKANYIKSTETIIMKSEHFMFYKNYTNNSDFGSLHPPSEKLFEISKSHINLFANIFKCKPHIKNIKKHICEVCINYTKEKTKFNEWFSDTNPCYDHNIKFLNFLMLVLIRKHSKWTAKKYKNSNSNYSRLNILKS